MIKKNKRIIFIMTLIAFIWVNNTSIFIKNEEIDIDFIFITKENGEYRRKEYQKK